MSKVKAFGLLQLLHFGSMLCLHVNTRAQQTQKSAEFENFSPSACQI